jgi:hypothetical protein
MATKTWPSPCSPTSWTLDDVGVREAGEGLGLAQEAGAAVGVVARSRVEQLDGDLAVELLVVGGVDDAHAAAAE